MFNICFDYFNEHDITISTNPDPLKSKTKCIYFPYGKQEHTPTPILMGDKELPWVDTWPHLGNNIDKNDFVNPGKGCLYQDLMDKRGSFIGKFHSLHQEFGFTNPDVMMKIVQIYATSFYGSPLWSYSSKEAEKLFTSWNILVRQVYGVPNTTHRYLIESMSKSKHLKTVIYKRYLSFLHSVVNSKKDCLSSLGKKMIVDCGSITMQNLELISKETGQENIMGIAPCEVINGYQYSPIPLGEEWRVGLLDELIDLRNGSLNLEWDDNSELSPDDLNDLINFVATS